MKMSILTSLAVLSFSTAIAASEPAKLLAQCPDPIDGTNSVLLAAINNPSSIFESPPEDPGMLKLIEKGSTQVSFYLAFMSDDGTGRIKCAYTSSVGLIGVELKKQYATAALVNPSNNAPSGMCNSSVADCSFEINLS